MGTLYHLLILVAGSAGVIIGFRKGLLRQMGALLGIALGFVADRVFHSDVERLLSGDRETTDFLGSVIASVLIFAIFYFAMLFFGAAIGRILSVIGGGLLDSIFGALGGLFQSLIVVSICFNIILGIDEQSCLLKYGTDDDGNMIEGVLYLAPSLLNCESFTDLARRVQLREAQKISYNKNQPAGVKQKEPVMAPDIHYRYA